MARHLRQARTCRVVGSLPPLGPVPLVAPGVRELLVSRREAIQRLAGGQLHARHHEMQLGVALMPVSHPEHVVLVALQASKDGRLEVVDQLLLLLLGRVVAVAESDHAAAVLPGVANGINQHLGACRVTAHHFGRGYSGLGLTLDALALGIEGWHDGGSGVLHRSGATTAATVKQLHQHRRRPLARRGRGWCCLWAACRRGAAG